MGLLELETYKLTMCGELTLTRMERNKVPEEKGDGGGSRERVLRRPQDTHSVGAAKRKRGRARATARCTCDAHNIHIQWAQQNARRNRKNDNGNRTLVKLVRQWKSHGSKEANRRSPRHLFKDKCTSGYIE